MTVLPLAYHARHLVVRRTTTAATVLGVALAALVVAAAQMAVAGLGAALGSAGREDVAVVLLAGSDGELTSQFDAATAARAAALAPGDAASGVAVSSEVVVTMTVARHGGGASNLVLRGVDGDAAAATRPALEVARGRAPAPGADEIMVGRAVAGRFVGLGLGETVELTPGRGATVVGVFAAGGDAAESEVWGPRELVARASGRSDVVSSLRVRVPGPDGVEALRRALAEHPDLGVEATSERALAARQGRRVAALVRGLGALIGGLLVVAAALGAAVTLHAQVAHRRREIAVLRALGFARRAVLLSFLLEALLLAAAGGGLGALGAWALDGAGTSLVNLASFTEVRVTLTATPATVLIAFTVAAAVGLLGGLGPAVRAARVPPSAGLR